MIIWSRALLGASQMFYTENQRKLFFDMADGLCRMIIAELIKKKYPERSEEAGRLTRESMDMDEWWDTLAVPQLDLTQFLYETVHPSLFELLKKHNFYREEIIANAPEETPEDWYKCSTVKSLLHEFINDEKDPYKIIQRLSDKEIACFSYAICSIYTDYLKKYLHVNDEDSDWMLKILYCGEFAQNDYINMIYGEKVQKIRSKVTMYFFFVHLFHDYNMGISDQPAFYEFLHDEVVGPVYRTILEARYEILSAGEEYLFKNEDEVWSPRFMEGFYRFILENVKMEFEAPDVRGFTEGTG